MKSPKYKTCSVLMAVYHGDEVVWTKQAIDSILDQTVKSDDIVIVRDGLVGDGVEKLLKNYEKRKDVRVIRLKDNGGLAHALNIGLAKCKNELIARMDADDVMVRKRLELQIAEFCKRPNLDILGGQIDEFDGTLDNIVGHRATPLCSADIKKFARLRSPFNHVSVMYKREKILSLGGYSEDVGKIEDYELWQRVVAKDFDMANLPDVLCMVRADDGMIGRRRSIANLKDQIKCRRHFLRNKWISVGDFIVAFCICFGIFIMPKKLIKMAYRSR